MREFIMQRLRSFIFNIVFWIWNTSVLFLCSPINVMPLRMTFWFHPLWSRGTFKIMSWIVRITHRVEGMENMPPHTPCILAAKHQSAWDTIVYLSLFQNPAFVLKKELYFVPIYGFYLKHFKMICVDRSKGAASLRRMLREVDVALKEGRHVIIFPEGTRVNPDQRAPLQPGVAALYKKIKAPLIPVATNSGVFWPRRSFLKKPGTIILKFLPAIKPGLDRKEFLETLEEILWEESTALPGSDSPTTLKAPRG